MRPRKPILLYSADAEVLSILGFVIDNQHWAKVERFNTREGLASRMARDFAAVIFVEKWYWLIIGEFIPGKIVPNYSPNVAALIEEIKNVSARKRGPRKEA